MYTRRLGPGRASDSVQGSWARVDLNEACGREAMEAKLVCSLRHLASFLITFNQGRVTGKPMAEKTAVS